MENTKRNELSSKLQLHNDLKQIIVEDKKNFKGIKDIRANHLKCLSSLLGLLPIDFYVNVPFHLEGGTGTFLKTNVWGSSAPN